jgi:hypothetical protein
MLLFGIGLQQQPQHRVYHTMAKNESCREFGVRFQARKLSRVAIHAASTPWLSFLEHIISNALK